jgi:hypothetical protein
VFIKCEIYGCEGPNREAGSTTATKYTEVGIEFNTLVADDGSLGSSGSGDLVDGRVLSDGLGGSVVSSLSSEHTLLDSGVVGVSGTGTNVRGVVVSVNLFSVGVVDGVGTVRVLSGLELESG